MQGKMRLIAVGIAVVCALAAIAATIGRGSAPRLDPEAARHEERGCGLPRPRGAARRERGRRRGRGLREPRVSRRHDHLRADAQGDEGREEGQEQGLEAQLEVGFPRAVDARRRPARDAEYLRPTEWSGRVTAFAVDPKCRSHACTLYVGAAGGGVWRSKNALAPKPSWKFISDDIPSNAVGSITVDPTDASGKTCTSGPASRTGAATASPVSASTRRPTTASTGRSSRGRSPRRATARSRRRGRRGRRESHPLATRNGTRGVGSNGGSATPRARFGIYESHDGGATFALVRAGTTFEIRFDPSTRPSSTRPSPAPGSSGRATAARRGRRSSPARARVTPSRPSPAQRKDADLPRRRERGGQSSQAYRIDDAHQPAATLTDNTTPPGRGSRIRWTARPATRAGGTARPVRLRHGDRIAAGVPTWSCSPA